MIQYRERERRRRRGGGAEEEGEEGEQKGRWFGRRGINVGFKHTLVNSILGLRLTWLEWGWRDGALLKTPLKSISGCWCGTFLDTDGFKDGFVTVLGLMSNCSFRCDTFLSSANSKLNPALRATVKLRRNFERLDELLQCGSKRVPWPRWETSS